MGRSCIDPWMAQWCRRTARGLVRCLVPRPFRTSHFGPWLCRLSLGQHEHIAFDFLGYTFQPRRAKNRWGRYFVSFLPAISPKAATAIRQTIRNWRMASTRNNQRLEDLARLANPVVQGWLNYYGRFYRSRCVQVLRHFNKALGKWAQRKYTRFRRRGACGDALAGAHRPPRSRPVRSLAAGRAAGGWSVGAG